MRVLFNTIGNLAWQQTEHTLYKMAISYARMFPKECTSVIVREDDAERYAAERELVRHLAIPKKSGSLFAGRITDRLIGKRITEIDPDVVVTNHPVGIAYELFVAGPVIENEVRKGEPLRKKQREYLSKMIERSKRIIVFSTKEKEFLAKYFPDANEKTELLYRIPAAESRPLTFEEKQNVKETYSAGNEFFLCGAADVTTIIGVLKGFSGFKKWQRSGMKLLVTAADSENEKALNDVLSSYRFKDDVSVITVDSKDFKDMVSAAYAVMLPDANDSDFSMPINVLRGGTVAMIPIDSVYSELAEKTAFSFIYLDSEDITRVLLEAFRDEKKRADIISRSKEKAEALQEKNFIKMLRRVLSEVK